ncbi:hypothetical protein HMPREF9141_1921 [Prevotella multiformis DSM 16608]|uniref:Uncharacterized protein n=1 Tax=Prevotella multiformis DSM 16608 TaxID=888743 RepID=F0F8K4_9BACT|nr:hypothetical protein HMPREF9141_1921 [Prevotella multiformis DSM 16608]
MSEGGFHQSIPFYLLQRNGKKLIKQAIASAYRLVPVYCLDVYREMYDRLARSVLWISRTYFINQEKKKINATGRQIDFQT